MHPHEAPATMTIPLVVLAGLSMAGGFVGIPASLGGGSAIEGWLEPVFAKAGGILALPGHDVEPIEYLLMALSVLIALAGIGLARAWYTKMPEVPKRVAQRSPTLYRLLLNKYYVDEVYDATVVTPLVKGSESLLWKVVDVRVIDGLVNGTARAVAAAGRTLRMVQTGVVHNYMLLFIAGVVMILGWLIAH